MLIAQDTPTNVSDMTRKANRIMKLNFKLSIFSIWLDLEPAIGRPNLNHDNANKDRNTTPHIADAKPHTAAATPTHTQGAVSTMGDTNKVRNEREWIDR